ncbi:PspC domain-containing protein [Nocardioides sp.]|uniref:ATP-binding protein n=1 Tax=Nocardioides sp. TaxID=35761 RepID=UPI0039E6BE61
MTAQPLDRMPRKASRDTQNPVLGGVAAGLARHLGLPVLWVRVAFVALAVLQGLGVALYAGLWLCLRPDSHFETDTPGGESASRGGRRPGPMRRLADAGPAIALAALGIGVILVVEALFGVGAIFWPLILAVAGIALLWRQADEAQRERWLDQTGRLDVLRLVVGGGWAAWVRIAAGIALLGVAVVLLLFDNGHVVGGAEGALLAAVFVLVALTVVVGPWLHSLGTDLSAEREERIRTQERADVAAHLHDSVLQTLALIQKNAADPGLVARLARSQERDLRSWLYAGESASPDSLAGALRTAAAEVEDSHGIAVDVVVVGDAPFAEYLRPVAAAAREALVNAAKHAQVSQVSVYAEITATEVEVFVRDRGVGFDTDDVPEDRHGVTDSIIARMERHGGSAVVRSTPGEGTEVHLSFPVEASDE